ncbi:MAG: GH127 / GH146 [uncultured Thermomicrobiales bacterium]|uniref:GH127 / GH146 n=1 Tax=uncultured Thermomicrobiales bacterium TaxID=1645740 RepID=A0A6J4V7L3_9BACT|nr:MAG: GH127 / GH146 [uncultured Thermomicrobiales bacterium]
MGVSVAMVSLTAGSVEAALDAPVVDTSRSPYARLRPLGVGDARLEDRFWAPRRERNRTVTLPSQWAQCEETGRLDNFRRAAGRHDGPFQGRVFNDSDIYKWLEAASWTLATGPDPALKARVDEAVALVAAAQDADGYLNTYFTFDRAAERWSDLEHAHELYCAGHLIQAAVAHHRATGERSLLDVAVRLAEHIAAVFGPDAGPGTCGHPEIEMALVELARTTGDPRWVRQAGFFVDQRGRRPTALRGGSRHAGRFGPEYFQDHLPVREQRTVAGHAVRALYLYGGVTDLYAETGEPALRETVGALWDDLQGRQSYVTGGAGARHEGEAFGEPYELPNATAYAETCAAIAHVMWAWRMLLLTGEVRFADALETALYNGVLSGLSLDGREYFYVNPLADRGDHRRLPWYGTACCPPNLARLLASLPGYGFATSDEGLWVHLYATGTATAPLPGGGRVAVAQRTEYPWDGAVELEVRADSATPFALFLRVPTWAAGATVAVNGTPLDGPVTPGSYAEVHRSWRDGDVVRLELPLAPRLLASHPRVAENHGRAALARGPVVYCLEQADHPDADVWDLAVPAEAEWTATWEPDLLGGVTALRTDGHARTDGDPGAPLYRPLDGSPPVRPARITAIPYHVWANREPGPMQVWIPTA